MVRSSSQMLITLYQQGFPGNSAGWFSSLLLKC